jgi:hypothetical protein
VKRPYRYLVVWLFVCLVAGVILGARADAARLSSGSGFTIQGAPVCSSALPSFGIFAWNGSTFCETQTPQAATLSLGINPPLAVLGVNGSGFLTLVTNSNSGSISIDAAGHWIPTGGLGWGGGTDINQLNGTRTAYNLFIPTTSGVTVNHTWGAWAPTVASHVRRLDVHIDTTGVTCGTAPVLNIHGNEGNFGTCATTLSNGTVHTGAACATTAVTAGERVGLILTTAAAGCATFPANINATLEVTTD